MRHFVFVERTWPDGAIHGPNSDEAGEKAGHVGRFVVLDRVVPQNIYCFARHKRHCA